MSVLHKNLAMYASANKGEKIACLALCFDINMLKQYAKFPKQGVVLKALIAHNIFTPAICLLYPGDAHLL